MPKPTTFLHRAYGPLKKHLPPGLSAPLRRLTTALVAPLRFAWQSGHFRSSLAARAMSSEGEPLPWYTYPCIRFLEQRSFAGKRVLEFGGGQSSLWWAARADGVTVFEGDRGWLAELERMVPDNVAVHFASAVDAGDCRAAVEAALAARGEVGAKFDIIVIDGLVREAVVPIALERLAPDGAIIVDNAEGYGFRELFLGSSLSRVDFHGMVPGVVLEHTTAIYYPEGSFLFRADQPFNDRR